MTCYHFYAIHELFIFHLIKFKNTTQSLLFSCCFCYCRFWPSRSRLVVSGPAYSKYVHYIHTWVCQKNFNESWILKVFLKANTEFPQLVSGETNQSRGELYKTQCFNSVKGGDKSTLWAVEYQIRQLFISIKPPDVVGTGAFELFGHNWWKTMFLQWFC